MCAEMLCETLLCGNQVDGSGTFNTCVSVYGKIERVN